MRHSRSPFGALVLFAPLIVTSCGGEGAGIITGEIDPVAALVEVTAVTLTLTSLGATVELRVTAKNAGGDLLEGKTFTWSSSDPSVVTVDGSVSAATVVTAVSNGMATITVSTDGVEGSVTLAVSQVVATIEVTPMDPQTLSHSRGHAGERHRVGREHDATHGAAQRRGGQCDHGPRHHVENG